MSMPSSILSHFEFAVLNTIRTLGDKAYPAEIKRHLSTHLQRDVAIAQVTISLGRMKGKGYVESRISGPFPVKGGRAVQIFQIHASGEEIIERTSSAYTLHAEPSPQ